MLTLDFRKNCMAFAVAAGVVFGSAVSASAEPAVPQMKTSSLQRASASYEMEKSADLSGIPDGQNEEIRKKTEAVKHKYEPRINAIRVELGEVRKQIGSEFSSANPRKAVIRKLSLQAAGLRRKQYDLFVDQLFDTMEALPKDKRAEFLRPFVNRFLKGPRKRSNSPYAAQAAELSRQTAAELSSPAPRREAVRNLGHQVTDLLVRQHDAFLDKVFSDLSKLSPEKKAEYLRPIIEKCNRKHPSR